jgi:hypothetical protein
MFSLLHILLVCEVYEGKGNVMRTFNTAVEEIDLMGNVVTGKKSSSLATRKQNARASYKKLTSKSEVLNSDKSNFKSILVYVLYVTN